jgi:Ca-activated chloride channel homolog
MNQEHSNELPTQPSGNGEIHDEAGALLTAFALGELAESERATHEASLRESLDDRQSAEALKRLGRLLRKVAGEVPLPEPSADLRGQVLAELAKPIEAEAPVRLPERFPRRRLWLPLSLAASIAILCGTLFGLMKMRHSSQVSAQRDSTIVASLSDGAADHERGVTYADEDAAWEMGARYVESDRAETVITDLAAKEQREQVAAEGESTYEFSTGARKPRTEAELAADPEDATPTVIRTGVQAPHEPQGDSLRLSEGLAKAKSSSSRRPQPLAESAAPASRESLAVGGRGRTSDRGSFGAAGAPGGMVGGMSGPGIPVQRDEQKTGRRGAGQKSTTWFDSQPARSSHDSGKTLPAKTNLTWQKAELETAPAPRFEAKTHNGYYNANAESYPALIENPFRKSTEHPLSTFSIDVDTASYTNVRRFLNSRSMPPTDAVRIEELINYFQYSYPQPEGEVPFSVTTDMADCPWNAEHRLLRVGLKGREVAANQRPASNLVFLLDVSGSMEAANKLPLVKEAMFLLTDKLTENDRVAIVVYAGNSGMVLPPTNGENKPAIRNAISQLVASGSTNGGQGLQMAYDTAQSQFIKGGTNRVILATDGDFNVGVVDQNDLVKLIEEKAKGGVFLSALGFGVGNLKDGTLEKLADKGNGNYAYIDTLGEARRVLVEQLSGTLVTIAKDVKLQIEFNPAQAAEYRLIGYEDRVMPHQDFHDDRKDAGEIGAGHSVTALYEIVPAAGAAGPGGEPLKYQRSEKFTPAAETNELATIKLRYKEPEGSESRLIERVVSDRRPPQAETSRDLNFAAAVAGFGMLLRQSPYRGTATYKSVLALAEQGLAGDAGGYRSEFVQLVRQAQEISGQQ